MKQHPVTCLVLSCMLLLGGSRADAFECNVCHSKNPAMVRMHKAIQAKEIGCFDCHKVGEKLLGKGRSKSLESLLKRRSANPACVGCHDKPAEGSTAIR